MQAKSIVIRISHRSWCVTEPELKGEFVPLISVFIKASSYSQNKSSSIAFGLPIYEQWREHCEDPTLVVRKAKMDTDDCLDRSAATFARHWIFAFF